MVVTKKYLGAGVIVAIAFLLLSATFSFAETITNQYDELNRLASSQYGSRFIIRYYYDDFGNRTQKTVNMLDSSAPDTTIVSKPGSFSTASVIFTFASTPAEATVTFGCQLDGGVWSACNSGTMSYDGLTAGSHTFSVRATDRSGNTDATPASYTWKVDTTAPVTTATPAGYTFGTWTNSGSVSVSLSVDDVVGGSGVATGYPKYCVDATNTCTPSANSTLLVVTCASGSSCTQYLRYFSKDNANNIEMVKSSLVKQDLRLPDTVLVSTPASLSNSSSFAFSGSDQGSGVASFECQLDSGLWTACTSPQSYAITDGIHTFNVRAKDVAGNVAEPPASYQWKFDGTLPTLVVSTLSNNSVTNNVTLNIAGTVADANGMQGLTIAGNTTTINGDGSFSAAVVLQEGSNVVTTSATDLAGNVKSDTRTVVLDLSAPLLSITGPSDNSRTNQGALTITGSVGGTASVTVKVNSAGPVLASMTGSAFTYQATLVNGINTLEITATDTAGKTSTLKRTVTYDSQKPVLSITDPVQDIRTNLASLVVKGAVAGIASPTVTVTMGSNVWSPALTGGEFAQTVAFNGGKTYQINVAALDAAGNKTTVQRNVVYSPIVTVNPVTSPTNQRVQTLSGTVEKGALVHIACPTANVGTVSYPTPTTWTATLTNITEGGNSITITVTDGTANSYPAVNILIVVDTIPPIVSFTAIAPTASPTNVSSASFSFTSEAGLTIECRIDTQSFTPCPGTKAYVGLSDGSHEFDIKATDSAGNTGTALYTWAVDTLAPKTLITSKPVDPSNSTTAGFVFSSEPSVTFECRLDNAAFAACVSPKQYSGLPDGPHTFDVRATDRAGNIEPTPANHTWYIDTVAPSTSFIAPSDGSGIVNGSFVIRGTASDVGSSVSLVELSINNGAWTTVTGTTNWSYNWTIPSAGTYSIRTRATDAAGNIETPHGITVTAYVRTPNSVTTAGWQLLVNNSPFTVKGVNYSPVPVGDDPGTSPYGDYFTSGYSSIHDRDLPQLRQMGANTVSLWAFNSFGDHAGFLDAAYNGGVSPIYIIAGYHINAGQNIADANVREQIKSGFRDMIAVHKDHPAILIWAIGSDLNSASMYGSDKSHLFSLVNEMAAEAHAEDPKHPVMMPLADENLVSTITAYGPSVSALDLWGANVYRGNSFGTLFTDYGAVSTKPLLITGYGIDAYNDASATEDKTTQAGYAGILWNEITAGSETVVGGVYTEYSDQWWAGSQSVGAGCPEVNNPNVHGRCGILAPSFPDGYDNFEWRGLMSISDNGTNPDIMTQRPVYTTLKGYFTAGNPPLVTATTPTTDTTPTWTWATGGNGGNGTFRYRLDNPDLSTGFTTTTLKTYTPWTVLSAGRHILYVQEAASAGGWSANGAKAVVIDLTAPTTTTNAPVLWVNSGTVTVTLTATDNTGGSGVAATKYCSPLSTCTPATVGNTVTLICASGNECSQTIRYFSIDNAGNSELAKSVLVRQDLKAPQDRYITATAQNGQIVLSWSAGNDTGSGLAVTNTFKVVKATGAAPANCSGTALYTGVLLAYTDTAVANGQTYGYRVCEFDAVGNVSTGVTAIATMPSITVVMPYGGQTIAAGQEYTIFWTNTGNAGANVKIDLYKGGVFNSTIVASTPLISTNGCSPNCYTWTVPATQTAGSDYKIRITSTTMTTVSAESNAAFTIISPIAVTSPNGGETYVGGDTYTISWTYAGNLGAAVKIDLYKSGAFSSSIIASTPMGAGDAGSYNWTVPTSQTPGSDYKIRVTSTAMPTVSDESNNAFTINASSISGTVTSGGSPLSGVTVTLSGASTAGTETNASGNYIFTGLVDGSYTVRPGKAGYVFTPVNQSVAVSGANVSGQNFSGIANDAIAMWTMDTATISGNVLLDGTVNGNDGAISGAVGAPGMIAEALKFDGTNDYVSVPDSPSLDLTDAITIEAWVKRDVAGVRQTIVAKYATTNNMRSYYIDIGADNLFEMFLGSADGTAYVLAQGKTPIAANQWYHVAATWDRNGDQKIHLYVNGVEDTYTQQQTKTDTINVNTGDVWIGNRQEMERFFQGLIDDVQMYNYALTPVEILNYYNQVTK